MTSSATAHTHPRAWIMAAALLTALLGACTHAPERRLIPTNEATTAAAARTVPVVRYGRYTLVEAEPTAAQSDLLSQMIDVSIPASFSTTLGNALDYVLLRSGYALCEDREEVRVLQALPLPAAHLHLGPMTLRQTLRVLAGPGWELRVDEGARSVCYARVPPALAHSEQAP